MTQELRADITFAENLSSVSSIHSGYPKTTCNSSSGASDAVFWLPTALHSYAHPLPYTSMHIIRNKNKILKK